MLIGVNQKSSPIKFCFLIKPNANNRFDRAIKIAFSLWGGIYSPIFPLYKKMPKSYRQEYDISLKTKDYYRNSINNYDPDLVLYDQELDKNYIEELIEGRKLIKIEDFQNDLSKGNNQYGINILQIVKTIIESEFKFKRNDNLKLQLPNTLSSSLFLKSFFGVTINNLYQLINDSLDNRSFYSNPKLNNDNISDYYPNNNITFLELATTKISTRPERHWYRGVYVYFINEDNLNDLVNFWNLRALGWSIIPMPINQIENKYFNNLLERFANFQLENSNQHYFLNYLISSTTNVKQEKVIQSKLTSLKDKTKKDLKISFQRWFPRFWEERSILEADKTICENTQVVSKYSSIETKDNFVKFKIEELPLNVNLDYNSGLSYKVGLSFTYYDEFATNAGLVYGIDSIDWIRLTQSFGAEEWRLSKSGLYYYVRGVDDTVSFSIPKAIDFFRVYFSKRLFTLKETANGQLAQEVLKNIGGVRGSYFLRNKSALNILDLFEDGNIVSFPQIIGEIKKNLKINNNSETGFYLKRLIENKIIEFGAKIQCSICNQRTFYLLDELSEKLSCSVCRNKFELPLYKPKEIAWSYRGVGPFSKNNKVGGLMSVFLTLKLFSKEFADTTGNMSSLIGFELQNRTDKKKEVDLAVLLQKRYEESVPPDLFFCECKTFKNFTAKDIERMIELGEEFPNSILVFSTLNDDLLENEKAGLTEVANHFRHGFGNRPKNPVLILTAKELIPEKFYSHFKEYKDKASTYQRYNDWIGNLCEFTVEKHLGLKTWGDIRSERWVAEMKKRNKKNAPQQKI